MNPNRARLGDDASISVVPQSVATPPRTPSSAPEPNERPDTDAAVAAQVSLRYRPGADVLLGVVSYGDDVTHESAAETVERPDADTRLVWRIPSAGSFAGETLLTSFEVIHARARWDIDELAVLPRALAVAGYSTMAEGTAAYSRLETSIDRLRYRTEHTLEFPVRALRPPARGVRADSPDLAGSHRNALGVARALERLADALRRTTAPDPVAHQRITRFCLLADELGGVLADAKTPIAAPNTSAALRAELRGGLPLARSERAVLRDALMQIDSPAQWPQVAAQLLRVAGALTDDDDPAANEGSVHE